MRNDLLDIVFEKAVRHAVVEERDIETAIDCALEELYMSFDTDEEAEEFITIYDEAHSLLKMSVEKEVVDIRTRNAEFLAGWADNFIRENN